MQKEIYARNLPARCRKSGQEHHYFNLNESPSENLSNRYRSTQYADQQPRGTTNHRVPIDWKGREEEEAWRGEMDLT